ncbi:hypothetical protein N5E30_03255 [Pseudomonas chengduensis]|uniref:hypothetical protein n=1 Tax=Ectopseudomonas oleovorans TaxID=301 RepID=UPI00244D04C3|nr:hypothetical protein [Pseudomonas chengduensis]MDH1680606.1 hypothetical protein [Pseudomonas chengduensis]
MKTKLLLWLTISLTPISYAKEYSSLEQSREYVDCLGKSLLAAPSCAKAEREKMENSIEREKNIIIYSYQGSIPDIYERIEISQSNWKKYVQKKCSNIDIRLNDLCVAKLSDYRASYLSAFNELEGDISTLLSGLDNYEKNDSFAAAWINSFLPAVELDKMKKNGALSSDNKITNPITSQDLLYNAQQISDPEDAERISLIKASAEKGNLYAGILFFKAYLHSNDLKKIKDSEKIIIELERHNDIGFLSKTFRAQIKPTLIATAKSQGATAYRGLMRDFLSNGSEPQVYATLIDSNLLNAPTCERFALAIYDYANSNLADNVKMIAINNLADGAVKSGCLIP